MGPTIRTQPAVHLVGLSYYGNPFHSAQGWAQENEIGKLWNRLSVNLDMWDNAEIVPAEISCEVHIFDETIDYEDDFTVVAGVPYNGDCDVPLMFAVHHLPAGSYARWEFSYEEIKKGYMKTIFEEWLPASGYRLAQPFIMQEYKGQSSDDAQTITVCIPIIEK